LWYNISMPLKFKIIRDIKDLKNKIVLLRVDFNVPIEKGKIKDGYKIKASLPTIKYLLDKKAKIILVSHLGRPLKKEKKYSLKIVALELEKLLKRKIDFQDFQDYKKSRASVTLLENIRYHKEEQENDIKFSKSLSSLADIFVFDGFAVSHRTSASVVGVSRFLPTYGGFLIEKEINGLNKVLVNPKKPMIVVLGGAKMETKIPILKNLIKIADYILIGGGVANTFLKSEGYKVGGSLICDNCLKQALVFANKQKIILPLDVIVGDKNGKNCEVVNIDKKFKITSSKLGIYDVGPKTIQKYSEFIKSAKTLVWNGALGYFEQKEYSYGTYALATLISARSKGKAFGVCGGGETVEILKKLKVEDDIDLLSTGGGAMLEFLAGKKLPGLEILKK